MRMQDPDDNPARQVGARGPLFKHEQYVWAAIARLSAEWASPDHRPL